MRFEVLAALPLGAGSGKRAFALDECRSCHR